MLSDEELRIDWWVWLEKKVRKENAKLLYDIVLYNPYLVVGSKVKMLTRSNNFEVDDLIRLETPLLGVEKIYWTGRAYTAVMKIGTVVTWGNES